MDERTQADAMAIAGESSNINCWTLSSAALFHTCVFFKFKSNCTWHGLS